jgi:hypothetical protein
MKTFRHIALAFAAGLLLLTVRGEGVAQIGGMPGAFSRMGFGARGIGMGNALTAVTDGDMVGYYNPALLPSAEYRHAEATFGVLSLDRTLNFLGYTQSLKPSAGISFGLINSGVSNIDGRDGDGQPTGALRTSEDQVLLGFGIRFKPGFSFGLNAKLHYYHLYTDVTSTTMGVDFGFYYPLNESFAVAATVKDISSKYKWDTSELLGQQGQQSEEMFPVLYTVGSAYRLPDSLGLLAADLEFSSASTVTLRAGLEVPLVRELMVRIGVDRIDLKEKGNGVRPAAGFTLRRSLGDWTPSVSYAFVLEPFAPTATHMISFAVIF